MSYVKSVFHLFVITYFSLGIIEFSWGQGSWTWMKGSNNFNEPNSSVGIGVSASTNTPGGRYETAEWQDDQGNFWLYSGGATLYTDYNGLWKYTPSTNQWMLMHQGNGTYPVYGTQGVGAPANFPGSTFVSQTWYDSTGYLWLYGGVRHAGIASNDDLWKYDINANQWIWVKGSGLASTAFTFPVYPATVGTFSSSNSPGERAETACSWVDNNGDLWLFGGGSVLGTPKNDIWKFDTNLEQWAWMAGDTTFGLLTAPNYGTIGVSSTTNTPGSRWCYSSWSDENGDLWIFGGVDGAGNTFNDLWTFNTTTLNWTWISGSNQLNDTGNYGQQCQGSIANSPPARMENRACWKDNCGNFWLFGGTYNNTTNFLNDLWRYSPINNEWTWVSGANNFNQAGNYGFATIPSTLNFPGARLGSVGWVNSKGLWLFGGSIIDPSSTHQEFNDLWLYTPDSILADFDFSLNCLDVSFVDQSVTGCENIKSWSWDFGDGTNSTLQNPSHTYSVNGMYDVQLVIENCFWGTDTIVKQVLVNCGMNVQLIPDTICEGECVDIAALVSGGTPPYNYQWNSPITDTDSIANNICPFTTTSYSVIVTDSLGEVDTATTEITVIPFPTVDIGNDTTLCGSDLTINALSNGSTYLWQDGSSNSYYTATNSGAYWVEVSNGFCSSYDSILVTMNNVNVHLGADIVTCEPDTVFLDAGNPGAMYLWQDGVSNNQIFNVQNYGTFHATATQYGCTSTDTVNVLADTISLNLPQDTIICIGDSVTINLGNSGANFNWSTADTTQELSISNPGTYWVSANQGLCSTVDTFLLEVITTTPLFSATDTTGCAPVEVSFSNLSTSNQDSLVSWFWNFGDGATSNLQHPSHEYSTNGIYPVSLVVFTSQGCFSDTSKIIQVAVNPTPSASFTVTPNPASTGQETYFTDQSIDAINWSWNFGGGATSSLQNPTHVFSEPGEYEVLLIASNNGCIDSVVYTVMIKEDVIFYVPNSFTPDGDEYNNVFKPIFSRNPAEYNLMVFNRWGELIFESHDPNIGWDGTYGGRIVQDGVYQWKLTFINSNDNIVHNSNGHINLLR